jgi:hypothetical protein
MQEVHEIMEGLAAEQLDTFLGYGRLHRIYCSTTGTHDALREFFQIVGRDPCSTFSVDDAFKETLRETAKAWLEHR